MCNDGGYYQMETTWCCAPTAFGSISVPNTMNTARFLFLRLYFLYIFAFSPSPSSFRLDRSRDLHSSINDIILYALARRPARNPFLSPLISYERVGAPSIDHEARTLYTFLFSFSHVYVAPYVSILLGWCCPLMAFPKIYMRREYLAGCALL
jgi:hypothetical protein